MKKGRWGGGEWVWVVLKMKLIMITYISEDGRSNFSKATYTPIQLGEWMQTKQVDAGNLNT